MPSSREVRIRRQRFDDLFCPPRKVVQDVMRRAIPMIDQDLDLPAR